MLTKPLLVALLAVCGVPNTGNTEPPNDPPIQPIEVPAPPQEDGQHFCCQALGERSGDGCVFISNKQAAPCDQLLYCAGSYKKSGDKVTCLA